MRGAADAGRRGVTGMGDMSAEPSMEEILSSIKRIIAEEEAPTGRRRATRIAPAREPMADPFADGEDEVLELSDPMPPAARALPEPEPARPEPARPEPARMAPPTVQPEPAAMPKPAEAPKPADPILSPAAADATRGALDSLSRLLVKPEPGGDGTLEGLVREMLRPMLRDWLDRNLPAMVEAMVAKEIQRISAQGR